MAILYGTTADGDSLPVEVNEFGQLVAQGLAGQPGTPGAPGPPGPPGVGELPPDPYEGAILGWENGALAWVGIPVPLPPGTFGPITGYANGVVTVADLPTFVQGQFIFLSDDEGNRYTYTPTSPPISRVAKPSYFFDSSDGLADFQIGDVLGSPIPVGNIKATSIQTASGDGTDALNQSIDNASPVYTADVINDNQWIYETLSGSTVVARFQNLGSSKCTIYTSVSDGETWAGRAVFDLMPNVTVNVTTSLSSVETFLRFYFEVSSGSRPLTLSLNDSSVNGEVWSLLSFLTPEVVDVSVQNKYLTIFPGDFRVGEIITAQPKSGEGIVQSVAGDAITLASPNDEWQIGQYVTASAQKVAARYLADGDFLSFVKRQAETDAGTRYRLDTP